MRRNKRLPLLAGVLIILLLAAGCGSKAPETEDEGPSWPAQETLKTVDASDIKSITYTRNTEGGGISETVTDADDIEDIYLRLLNLSIKDDTAEGVDDDQTELEVRAGSKTLSFEFEGDVLVLGSGSRYKVDQLDMLISCLDKITAEIEEEEDDTGWSYDSGSDEDFDILDGYEIKKDGSVRYIYGNDFMLTMPDGDDWEIEPIDDDSFKIYLKQAKEDGYEGDLVTIKAYDMDDDSYMDLPSYHVAGIGRNVDKRFVAIYPTDARWNSLDSEQADRYKELQEHLQKIGEGAANSPMQFEDSSSY